MAHEWLRAILRWAVSQTDLNRHRLREDLKRAVELLASIGTSAGKEAPITVVARALSDPSPRVGGGFISTLASSAAVAALGVNGARGAGVALGLRRASSSALASAHWPKASGIAAALRHLSKLGLSMASAMPLDRLLIALTCAAIEELARRGVLMRLLHATGQPAREFLGGLLRKEGADSHPNRLVPMTSARPDPALPPVSSTAAATVTPRTEVGQGAVEALPSATSTGSHCTQSSPHLLVVLVALMTLLIVMIRLPRWFGNDRTSRPPHGVRSAGVDVQEATVPCDDALDDVAALKPNPDPKQDESSTLTPARTVPSPYPVRAGGAPSATTPARSSTSQVISAPSSARKLAPAPPDLSDSMRPPTSSPASTTIVTSPSHVPRSDTEPPSPVDVVVRGLATPDAPSSSLHSRTSRSSAITGVSDSAKPQQWMREDLASIQRRPRPQVEAGGGYATPPSVKRERSWSADIRDAFISLEQAVEVVEKKNLEFIETSPLRSGLESSVGSSPGYEGSAASTPSVSIKMDDERPANDETKHGAQESANGAPPQPVLRTVTSGDIHDEAANTTSPVASAADLERRSTASVYRAQYSYMQAATARMLSPDSTPEGFRPGNGMGMLAPRSLLNSVPGWEQRAEALAVMNKASRQNDPGGVINRFVRAETRFVRAFRGVRSTRASPESSSSST